MHLIRLNVHLCVVSIFFTAIGATTFAQQPSAEVSPKTANSNEVAMTWIDNYSENQVLFHKKDIVRLREKIAKATPAQAKKWLDETKEIRQALDSPKWKDTRTWLKEFLRVQAIYSDDQIAHFRTETGKAAKESPEKFIDILLEVEKKRLDLVNGAASSARVREQQVAFAQAYRKEQAAARDAARLAAAKAAPRTPAPGAPRRREYRRPPTLISSFDVARWSVMREFWPNW